MITKELLLSFMKERDSDIVAIENFKINKSTIYIDTLEVIYIGNERHEFRDTCLLNIKYLEKWLSKKKIELI